MPPPPRLLLGITLLFWGGMTDHAVAGLLAALLVEGSHWIRVRWDFDETAFVRAWHLSLVLAALGAAMAWLDGLTPDRIYSFITWLPVFLLPVQFVQSYGTRDRVPVHVFAVIARRRIERDRLLGRMVEIPEIVFGHVTFVTALLTASLGANASVTWFLPVCLALVGWALRAGTMAGPSPWVPMALALALVGGIGWGGQYAMDGLFRWLSSGRWATEAMEWSGSQMTRTAIGRLGRIKQSPEIVWRLQEVTGVPPQLLRTAGYNRYAQGIWFHRQRASLEFRDDDFTDFAVAGDPESIIYRVTKPEASQDPAPERLPSFTLRGAIQHNSLLPLPGDTRSLRDPQVDEIEANSLGTVRITPKSGVLDTRVSWRDESNVEGPPVKESDDSLASDFQIPESELPGIRATVDALGLREGTLAAKTSRLRSFFFRNFRYTRYLTLPSLETGGRQGQRLGADTAISRFLTRERRGHCEYFASATTLLLREAGVPARYCVGFAVVEHDPLRRESTLRGTHAHAWCRAWDQSSGDWIDIDLTPPDWTGLEQTTLPRHQWLLDGWQRMREDVLIWRSQPGNVHRVTLGVIAVASVIALYVVLRLWKSRRRTPLGGLRGRRGRPGTDHPLAALERAARKRIGDRPAGIPLSPWLRQLSPLLPPASGLEEALALHDRIRFDPAWSDTGERQRLAALAGRLRASLQASKRAAARSGG